MSGIPVPHLLDGVAVCVETEQLAKRGPLHMAGHSHSVCQDTTARNRPLHPSATGCSWSRGAPEPARLFTGTARRRSRSGRARGGTWTCWRGYQTPEHTGDGFIAVAGVPEWRPDHAEAAADLALAMQAAMSALNRDLGTDLLVRIGINTSGPVVAGVIGTTKLLYSIVGDEMNAAARMESHGVPGRIHASDSVYHRLKDRYDFEERGLVDIKGKDV